MTDEEGNQPFGGQLVRKEPCAHKSAWPREHEQEETAKGAPTRLQNEWIHHGVGPKSTKAILRSKCSQIQMDRWNISKKLWLEIVLL